jgi:hypothetical protein
MISSMASGKAFVRFIPFPHTGIWMCLWASMCLARPEGPAIPLTLFIASDAQFRGMLFKAYPYFEEKANVAGNKETASQPVLGGHPGIAPLHNLKIAEDPVFTVFLSGARRILDDQLERWFIASEAEITEPTEGISSGVSLGLGKEWPTPSKVEVDFGI